MTSTDRLMELASLVRQRNRLDRSIAGIIGRPALPGHFGEFVAQEILGVALHDSAVEKGSDGRFVSGPYVGKTVNVKYYPKREGMLDINTNHQPDFYLVLTGPNASAASSKGTTRPWVIEAAYLFDAAALVRRLTVKIGIATSIRREFWDEAEVYPRANAAFPLTDAQRGQLALFSTASIG